MPRPPPIPKTALGRVLQDRRDQVSQEATARLIGIPEPTLSRIERGTHRPSYDTALALSRWLGWTVEQVMEAAGQAAGGEDA